MVLGMYFFVFGMYGQWRSNPVIFSLVVTALGLSDPVVQPEMLLTPSTVKLSLDWHFLPISDFNNIFKVREKEKIIDPN